MGFGRTGCNRKSGGKPPHSIVDEEESRLRGSCRRPKAERFGLRSE